MNIFIFYIKNITIANILLYLKKNNINIYIYIYIIGFKNATQSYLLEEDRSINALETDIFPGSLQIKLGYSIKY